MYVQIAFAMDEDSDYSSGSVLTTTVRETPTRVLEGLRVFIEQELADRQRLRMLIREQDRARQKGA